MGKVKIISDRLMEVLASKIKFRRLLAIMFTLGLIIISAGAVYLLLKDIF